MKLDLNLTPTFQERKIPPDARVAGWAALMQVFAIKAPCRQPGCVSKKHIRGSQRMENGWHIFDKRYWPGDSVSDHLAFALKHENLDLLILKRLFEILPAKVFEDWVRTTPTGALARCIWFLYEWLTQKTLDLPDAGNIPAINLLDPKKYYVARPRLSRRQRIRDNLLGPALFCPLIRRTRTLENYVGLALHEKARKTIGRAGSRLSARAASFLLLADSRASFEIEGERQPRNRLERWGRAVLQAGQQTLTVDEIVRLHGMLIEDNRFVRLGFRADGVFLGERDRDGEPLPEFVGAKPSDLPCLMEGLIEANRRMRESELNPVLQAAATAFGFVYVHPLQDGNGRLHRCLIHHVLAERKFTPPGMVFPVSSVMLDEIDSYRAVLQAHTSPLMKLIDWRPTPARNVEVLNDTLDLYSHFDCTEAAEFLYGCVQRTVDRDLPREIDFLRRHEDAVRHIMDAIEMPDRLAEDLIMFIRQNGGTLPKRRRQREFEKLNDEEVRRLEAIVQEAFDGFEE